MPPSRSELLRGCFSCGIELREIDNSRDRFIHCSGCQLSLSVIPTEVRPLVQHLHLCHASVIAFRPRSHEAEGSEPDIRHPSDQIFRCLLAPGSDFSATRAGKLIAHLAAAACSRDTSRPARSGRNDNPIGRMIQARPVVIGLDPTIFAAALPLRTIQSLARIFRAQSLMGHRQFARFSALLGRLVQGSLGIGQYRPEWRRLHLPRILRPSYCGRSPL
jgi:hypothetical protein